MECNEEYSLKIEASEVIKEIEYAVKFVEVSQTLKNADEIVHINLETKEGRFICVELTAKGFRVAGHQFDCSNISEENSVYYETVYALLDSISPGYRNTFGDALAEKLKDLQKSMDDT